MHASFISCALLLLLLLVFDQPAQPAALSVHWDKEYAEHWPEARTWHHAMSRAGHWSGRRRRRTPGRQEEWAQVDNASVAEPRALSTPAHRGGLEESQVDMRAAFVALCTGLAALLVLAAVAGCFSGKGTGGTHGLVGRAAKRESLSGGRLALELSHHGGSPYRRFSWALDSGLRGHGPVLDAAGAEVACLGGSLMAVPNGEMRIQSDGVCWAILGRPTPNLRRPGQLWDFKVCRANGSPFAVVRQRSEYKCIVEDAVTQKRVMEVVGNFFHAEFLTGERIVQAWLSKEDVGAQCQVRPDNGGVGEGGKNPAQRSPAAVGDARPRIQVTTTASAEVDFVLAVLVGLQDVHAASQHCVGLAGHQNERPVSVSSLMPKGLA